MVNKWDLIEKDTNTMAEFKEKVYDELKYLSYAPLLFISALTGQRVKKIMDAIDTVAEQTKKRIPTSPLNNYFERWVERIHPPLYRGRRVKLNYITQVSTAPPTFVIYTNAPGGIHFSYERYLINHLRRRFGFEGVPIRLYYRKKGKDRRNG
jgi:GTPase